MVSLSGLVVGALLGVVLHRGDFCMHSAFREVLARRPGLSIRAWLVALSLQVAVVNGLAGVGWLVVFRPAVDLWAALIGGFIFGVGMVMAKGWATSIWSRVGTGSLGAAVTTMGFAIGGVMAERGVLAPLRMSIEAQGVSGPLPTAIPPVAGVAPAMVVVLALTLLGLALWLLRDSAAQGGLWSWRLTGAALGAVGVLAWVTGAHAGWQWGLSATGPSRSLIDILLLGGTSVPLWGTLMIAGVPLGSWLSARIAGPVAWRAPPAVELPRRLCGGVLMGAGGTLAGGCNIGHALTGLSIFAVQSVMATAAIGAGAWCAIRLAQSWPASNRE